MKWKELVKVFAIPEFQTLIKDRIKLFLLVFTLSIALFSIGFSDGATDYLKIKMDNPFVKFVYVNVPPNIDVNLVILPELKSSEIKARYGYSATNMISTRNVEFLGINGETPTCRTQLVTDSDEMYNYLLSQSELMVSSKIIPLTDRNFSCIVTKKYLNKLGYSTFDSLAYINYRFWSDGPDTYCPIPIAGIVTELPDNMDLWITTSFFETVKATSGYDPSLLDVNSDNHLGSMCYFIPTDLGEEELKNTLKENELSQLMPLYVSQSFVDGWVVKLNSIEEKSRIESTLSHLFGNHVIRCYDLKGNFKQPDELPLNDPTKMVIVFSSLDSVGSFKDYLYDKHELLLDMNTVESKHNFNIISEISRILSLVLSILSLISISYVLTSMIYAHIEKNKKNLGTLKAFGLTNRTITLIYTSISTIIIIMIFLVSIVIVSLFGQILTSLLISLPETSVKVNLFSLPLNFKTILGFIVIPTLIVVISIYLRIKNKTPGDLIYERD